MESNNWTDRLDRALIDEFGPAIKPDTFWNVAAGYYGAYCTNFETDDPDLRSRIEAFIERFVATEFALP